MFLFIYFFLWPPYSPALVNGGSPKFYTWWTLSVIEEVTTWSPHYQKDKELLQKVQHRFTRMIEGFSLVPYEERLWKLGLWTLEEREIGVT